MLITYCCQKADTKTSRPSRCEAQQDNLERIGIRHLIHFARFVASGAALGDHATDINVVGRSAAWGFLFSEGSEMAKPLVILYHHDVCESQPNRSNSPGSINQALSEGFSVLEGYCVVYHDCLTTFRSNFGQCHALNCSILLVHCPVVVQVFHGGAGSCGKLH